MEFFAQFFSWLNTQLAGYIGDNVASVAAAIEPAAAALAVISVIVWGVLHFMGRIDEPLGEGLRRILLLGLVFGVGLKLWAYNALLVNTFFTAPAELAAAVLGAPSAVGVIDQVWADGNRVAEALLAQGSVLSGHVAYYFAAVLVYLLVGLACVYGAFLIALSLIAVAVLLALGPVFIVLTLFTTTRRYFAAWIGQLANYALIGILVALVASLLLRVVQAYAAGAVASGAEVTIAESARLCIAAVLIFLVMRQVMPMAAGLGSGLALSSGQVVSRAIDASFGAARHGALNLALGVTDRSTSRRDPLVRRAGYALAGAWRNAGRRAAPSREGSS